MCAPEMIDWLEKIGMGKYKNIFLENELRVYLLSDVTREQWTKWIPNEKDRKVIIDTINKTAGHSHTSHVHINKLSLSLSLTIILSSLSSSLWFGHSQC
jgi:hypothetical protein